MQIDMKRTQMDNRRSQVKEILCVLKREETNQDEKSDTMTLIHEYILSFITHDNHQLSVIAEEENRRNDIQPSVGPEAGKLIGLLIRLVNAKKVLEMGTCLGYSTVWIGQAMKETNGQLVSIEYDPELLEETKRNVKFAGVDSYVDLRHGDASEVIQSLEGPFDLIIQDSDKRLYPELLERCISLVRVNGIIIADDTLFKPMGIPDSLSKPMDEYNRLVFADPRLYSTILPIGDGVTVSVKIKDDLI